MKKMVSSIFLLLIAPAFPVMHSAVEAQVDIGLSAGDEGLRSFTTSAITIMYPRPK
ncbi:MAG: hypothetical protein MZV70_65765 [Desulfobacterales bacterium]|nr:hypothetical protein [Desulfobacterales bacterium]